MPIFGGKFFRLMPSVRSSQVADRGPRATRRRGFLNLRHAACAQESTRWVAQTQQVRYELNQLLSMIQERAVAFPRTDGGKIEYEATPIAV